MKKVRYVEMLESLKHLQEAELQGLKIAIESQQKKRQKHVPSSE